MSSPNFSELGLSSLLVQTISDLGYEQPSPIQAQSIPLLLAGKNLLGVAQTGTGKTAAFALPLLDRLDPDQKTPQILVLTPTRELAIQVSEACQTYARRLKGFHVLPVYGGADMGGQLKALKRGVSVVVGTPGRIMDHLRRNSLDLGQIRAVVLDEADEMLRMGFIDDVEAILSETPDSAQRALFSATMPAAIQRIASRYLGDAEKVHIESKTRTVEKISQRCLVVSNNEKIEALTRILEVEDFDGMIIFVRTKSATVEIAEKLEARGFSAAALNGDLNQQLRERTITRLKTGKLDIIVATDVAARGLDVERISHVVNYDIPYDNESYVHRIGRTGRAGREGAAILFVTHREKHLLRSIERSTGQPIEVMTLPGGKEVSQRRVDNFRSRVSETLETADLSRFKSLIEQWTQEEDRSTLDICAAMTFLLQEERPLFPEFAALELDMPRKAKKHQEDRPARARSEDRPPRDRGEDRPPRDRSEDRPRGEERPAKVRSETKAPRGRSEPATDEAGNAIPMDTYRMEVGYADGVQPKDIVGAIANEADIESRYIGRIEIFDDYCTVDLPEGMPNELLQHLRSIRIRQKPSRMQRVEGGGDAGARKPLPKPKGKKPDGIPPPKKKYGQKPKPAKRKE